MRSLRLRLLFAFALALLAAAPLLAQEDPGGSGDDDEDGGMVFPPELRRDVGRRGPMAPHEENRIHIPHSRELEVELRNGDGAAAAGKFSAASAIYLKILAEERDPADGKQRVAPVASAGATGSVRFQSYVRLVRERLYAFPEEGRSAFRELADPEARALYAQALESGSEADLERIWRTFPIASPAGDALERLGDMALESGEGALAADRYERAVRLPGGGLDPKRLAGKLARAKALAVASEAARATGGGPRRWPVVGGDNAHAAPLPPLSGIARAARLTRPLPPSRAGEAWGLRTPAAARHFGRGPFGGRDDAFAETIPTADAGRVVLVTERAAICFDLATGDRVWYQTPWSGKEDEKTGNLFYTATIARGRVFAPFTDKIVPAEFYRGIPIVEDMPHRRLVAFDLASGKRLWDQLDADDPFLRKASISLAPIERNGVLYAGATIPEGRIKTYLVAIDAASGKLVWKRFLGGGQVELTMFGEPAVEPLAMMPAEQDGTIYWCNAFGLVAAVSALTGEVEWLSTYETIETEAAQTYYARERALVWRNTPPVVADGVVVLAPIDSEKALGLDAQTGELRWAIDHGGDRRLLGIARRGDDGVTAVFQGDRLRSVDVRTGKLVGVFPKAGEAAGLGEEEAGRGLVSGAQALVPQSARVQRVDLQRGERAPDLQLPGGVRDSGSLLYVGRSLVIVNPQRMTVFDVAEGGGGASGLK
jgi:outer membrane protein assembly factor BamB